MTEWLAPFETKTDRRAMIERIIKQVHKLPRALRVVVVHVAVDSGVIDLPSLEAAASACTQTEERRVEHIFAVVDAFDVPQYEHCTRRKKLLPFVAHLISR